VKPYKARGVALGMLNVFELAISKVFADEAYMHSYGVMWITLGLGHLNNYEE
jgi:hypothetical protein